MINNIGFGEWGIAQSACVDNIDLNVIRIDYLDAPF